MGLRSACTSLSLGAAELGGGCACDSQPLWESVFREMSVYLRTHLPWTRPGFRRSFLNLTAALRDSTLVHLVSASFWKRSGTLGAQGWRGARLPPAAPLRRPVNGVTLRRVVITVGVSSSGVSPGVTLAHTYEFILKSGQRPESTAPGAQGPIRNVPVGAENHPGNNAHGGLPGTDACAQPPVGWEGLWIPCQASEHR